VIQKTMLIAMRELVAERRHPDGLAAALTFTGMLVVLESLAFGPVRAREAGVASGLYWIAVLFAGVLVAARAFERELEDDAIDAVIALDGGRTALFAGKTLALTIVIAIVAGVGGLLALLLLSLDVALPGHLALVAVLGVLALPPVIGLVSFLALRVRARVALVPILAFPMLVPQLVAATQGASAALSGDAGAALGWEGILAAFAIVYAVLGVTVVPAAIE
jgi:heme exporter protein B